MAKKVNKKIAKMIVADFAVEDTKKVVDLGNNKFEVTGSFGSVFRMSFGNDHVTMTSKGCAWKRKDMTKEVKQIFNDIRRLYRLGKEAAFRKLFDLLCDNECGAVVGVDENVIWYKANVLERRLKKLGFTQDSIDDVHDGAEYVAECTMYPGFRIHVDRDKIFDEIWERTNLVGKDFDGDMLFGIDKDGKIYSYVPEF